MIGLFVNSRQAQCSIHESGRMVYSALCHTPAYQLNYREADSLLSPAAINSRYDFVVFNWHHATTPQLTEEYIAAISIPKFTVVTECAPDNPIPQTPRWFSGYLVLDPTIVESANIYAMPRPLEAYVAGERLENPKPVIGSFGFATYGKRFDLLVEQVNKEFDEAVIRINVPQATFVDHTAPYSLAATLYQIKVKPGIELRVSHDYMSKPELINWCAQNDINVFFYYRNMIGLAAVTDQAVSAQRPLLVTEDYTFRHIHPYMAPYPQLSIKEAMHLMEPAQRMYNDWHPARFAEKFLTLLNK